MNSSPPSAQPRAEAVLWAATATMAMLVLDSSILGVMLPTVRAQLHLSPTEQTAVLGSYLFTLALALPVGGWLSDRFGASRLFVCGTTGFVIASLGIAVSANGSSLIAWRCVAGVAAGLLMPATMSLVTAVFPDGQRTRALAIYLGVGQAFSVIAPTIGGLCAQYIGWQAGFLANVPAGCVAVALLLWSRPTVHSEVSQTTDSAAHEQLWSPSLIAATVALALLGFAMTVATVYAAVDLQAALGLSPTLAGLALLPLVLPLLAATRWIAAHGDAVAPQRLGAWGATAMAVGLTVISAGMHYTALPVTCLGMIPTGVGIALIMGPISSAALGMVGPRRRGLAAAVTSGGRQLGGVAGIVAFAAISSHSTPAIGYLVVGTVMWLAVLACRRAVPDADRARQPEAP